MYNDNSDRNNTLPDRIKAIRKAEDLTQAQFSEKTGLSKTLISKLENGERNLSPHSKNAICISLGVNEDYLLHGAGEMFSDKPPTEIINQIAKRYGLCDADKIFLITYLEMDNTAKKYFADFLSKYINNYINYRL